MASTVRWEGLDALRTALRRLPDDLADEASAIVLGAATAAEGEAHSAYPERTGDLRSGLDVIPSATGRYGVGAILLNRAHHAHLFENGTQARHTAIGANRGAMPPGHVFVPIVIRQRRAMYERLKALLVRHGIEVSGDAE